MLSGTRQNYFEGVDYETFQSNDDYDGDGLKNSEEISVLDIGNGWVYVNFYSNPCVKDSDGDGYDDNIDFDPLDYDDINGLLYQSEKKMGIGYDGESLSDDLKVNDFSDDQLLDINSMFQYQISSNEDYLELDFRNMCRSFFSYGSGDMVNQLIDAFINGTDTTVAIETNSGLEEVPCYYNELLTQRVYNDEQVKLYMEYVKNSLVEQIKENDGYLIQAKRNMQSIIEDSDVGNIAFSRNHLAYLLGGLTISINDLWGSNVCITNYSFDGTRFSGTLHFTLYDHFGLDQPDVEKIYVNLAGFRAWYVLQHSTKYNGKYKPYINIMECDIHFNGVI